MSTRVTQVVRVEPIAQSAGGAARITQISRVEVADLGTPLQGGSARVTQAVRVIIIVLSSGVSRMPGGPMLGMEVFK